MNDRYENLVKELSNSLMIETGEFFLKKLNIAFNIEEDTQDVLNLIMSSYLSAMFNIMDFTAKDHENIYHHFNIFRKDLIEYISKMSPVKHIKITKEYL